MDKVVFLSLAVLGLIGAAHSAATCPSGYEIGNNNCYKFDTDERLPADAKTFCAGDGAHLVSVQTSAEFQYLKTEIESRRDQVVNPHNCWWTSGKQQADGTWQWEDTGLEVDSSEAPWWPNQPGEPGQSTIIDICDRDGSFGLNDQFDDGVRTNPTVCEQCITGFKQFENSCYKFDTDERLPADAKTFCEGDGAHLVSVQTSAEFQFLKTEIESRRDQVVNPHNCWWTSGKLQADGTWQWEDTGLEVDSNEAPWWPDQPGEPGQSTIIDICDRDNSFGLNDQFDDGVRTNPTVCEY